MASRSWPSIPRETSSSSSAPPWLSGRKGAEAGSFVGRWPEMPPALEGCAIRSRPLFSLHEGAWSPDRLEREIGAGPSAGRPRGEGARNIRSPT
ncbi:MAG: hypothetical protein JO329_11635 [Planctomycetaceae bacterium]|nr:hypothetical protein [Planctomycetaceae bacterium]